jgi:hypothetical protein
MSDIEKLPEEPPVEFEEDFDEEERLALAAWRARESESEAA